MAKGCLSIPAVWNVLKELDMENRLNMEDDDRMSTEMQDPPCSPFRSDQMPKVVGEKSVNIGIHCKLILPLV